MIMCNIGEETSLVKIKHYRIDTPDRIDKIPNLNSIPISIN